MRRGEKVTRKRKRIRGRRDVSRKRKKKARKGLHIVEDEEKEDSYKEVQLELLRRWR